MECIFLVETVGTCCISPDYTGSKFCFDVSDTKEESCAYGLPRVVGMNTALAFGYMSHLYIVNVFISQSKTRHKLFRLLNVGQQENIYL